MYKDFLIKGFVGFGNISKDIVGIAFLHGENKLNNGIYIWFEYNYIEEYASIRLGSSYQNASVLSDEDKANFNKEFETKLVILKNNYSYLTQTINTALDKYLRTFVGN